MLFRPTPDQNIAAVHALLNSWNAEADRYRNAAHAAKKGGEPTISLAVSDAEQTHEAITALLEDIGAALQRAASGSRPFMDLLRAQTIAFALVESVGKSRDALDGCVQGAMAGPIHIAHELHAPEYSSLEQRAKSSLAAKGS